MSKRTIKMKVAILTELEALISSLKSDTDFYKTNPHYDQDGQKTAAFNEIIKMLENLADEV